MNKHPVSQLQERMAKMGKPLPTYTVEHSSFATANKFVCTVNVDGITAVGKGSNKQSAKHEAATKALAKLACPDAEGRPETPESSPLEMSALGVINGNYIGRLNELASQRKLPAPSYSECGVNDRNEFILACVILDLGVRGFGQTKKQAKQHAAKAMLEILSKKSNNILNQDVPDLVDLTSDQVPHHIFPSDEDIIQKFKILAMKSQEDKEQQGPIDLLTRHTAALSSSASSSLLSKFQVSEQSTSELWIELEKIVPVSNLKVLQTRPKCILALDVGDEDKRTVMEVGDTYEKALTNLLQKAIILVKNF